MRPVRRSLPLLLFIAAAGLFASTPAVGYPTTTARVVACYDGDACTLDRDILPGRDRVRLRNADAPEMHGRCATESRLARQAQAFTAQVIGYTVTLTDVRLTSIPVAFDAFVRMPDGRDLGEALIAAGLARTYAGGQRGG